MSKKKSGILRNLRNPGIFRTGYIQNPGIFRPRGIFTTLPYSENPGILRTQGKFRTLSNIYDGALCKNC